MCHAAGYRPCGVMRYPTVPPTARCNRQSGRKGRPMRSDFKPLQNYPGIVLRGFLALLLICPATPLLSDEQTAVTSTRDATVNQAAPATNNGAATTLSTHTAQNAHRRSLLRSDLSTTGLHSNTALTTTTLDLIAS